MADIFDPTKYGGQPIEASGLTPEEEEELRQLNAAAGITEEPTSGLTPEEEEELRQLNEAADVTPVQPPKKEVTPGDIEEDELQDIADATGVTTDYLKQNMPALAGLTGGYMRGEGVAERGLERAAGEIGKQVLLGIPQKAYILSRDEKEQRALDMLRNLINEKQTTAQKAAELGAGVLLPGGVIAKGAKTVLGKLAAAAATGATYGATGAATGQEAEAAAGGAVIGGALGGALVGAGKLISKQAEKNAIKYAEDAEIVKRADAALQASEEEIQKRSEEFTDPATVNKLVPELIAGRKAIKKATSEQRDTLTEGIMKQEERLQDARKFAAYLKKQESAASVKDTVKTLKELADKEPEFLAREYRNYRQVEAIQDQLGDSVASRLPKQATWLTRMKNSLVDGAIVARWIDRRLAGSDVTVAMDKAAVTKRKYDLTMAAKIVEANDIRTRIKSSGVDETKLYRVMDNVNLLEKDGIQKAVMAGLTEQEAAIARSIRLNFETAKQEAAKAGLKIEERKAYIPHVRVSTPETIRRINKEAKKAGINIDNPETAEGISDLIKEYEKYRAYVRSGNKADLEKPAGLDKFVAENEAFVNVINAAEYLSGQQIKSPLDLGVAIRTFQNPTMLNRVAITEAERSLQRTLDMPDFIREKNVAKLYQDWNANTFRHTYFRDIIASLNKNRALAVKQNDKASATYINDLMQDLAGLREGTGLEYTRRSMQKFQVAMKQLADAAPEGSFRESIYETLGDSPEIFSIIAAQVYPNFLGLSARAVIANLTSPITMGLPELGGAYGTQKLIAAGLRGVNSIRAGREIKLTPEFARYLNSKNYAGRSNYVGGETIMVKGPASLTMASKNAGQMGPQYSSELFRSIQGGIKDKALYEIPMKGLEKWNNFSMYAFEKSETIIRTLMGDVGESVAIDLMARKPGAINVLNRMDKAYRRTVTKAMEAGDGAEVSRLMQNYLVGRTLFNYDRISMNEFGRSMGPIFSVFSKWPSTIAGDIIDRFEEKGAMKGTRDVAIRYFAPLAFLATLDGMLETMEVSPEQSDVAYRLLGKGGFASMASLNSVVPLLEGRVIKPPVIDAVAGALIALTQGADTPEALWKWANRTGQTFIPGTGFLRFAAEDVPVFLGEDRVEGPFFERVYKRITGER